MELINTIVIQEMELWENIKPIPAVNTMEDLYIVLLLGMVNLIDELYKQNYCQLTNQIFSIYGINLNLWYRACEIQTRLGINKFIIKLALFIQEYRKRVNSIKVTDLDVKCLERDTAQTQDLPISIYYSMICYI